MELAENILNANNISLFITRHLGLDKENSDKQSTSPVKNSEPILLYSRKVVDDKLLMKVLKAVKNAIQDVGDNSNIGKTYYYFENSNIRVIRFVQTRNEEQNSGMEFYLAFEPKKYKSEPTFSELINARNLLSMREAIISRLERDFNREHIELKDKVIKLSDQKAGSHTPFKELAYDFINISKLIEKGTCSDTLKQLANQIKLIADSIISKLYVCWITEKYPDNIMRYKERGKKPLAEEKPILELAGLLIRRIGTRNIVIPKINWKFDWETEFEYPNNCGYIWICLFFAIIMNSLRHGKSIVVKQNKVEKIEVVEIEVRCVNEDGKNYLTISNRMVKTSDKEKLKTGITLITIRQFFDYYGFSGFRYGEPDGLDTDLYIVKIPLEGDKKVEKAAGSTDR